MQTVKSKTIVRDLGDGLLLRRATAEDTEELARFNGRIHGNPDTGETDEGIFEWTRDLMLKHPTFRPEDFTVVEDARTGKIVSASNLISQRWTYAGIEFGVGRIELVGTDPAYRRRGLIRTQIGVIHEWSAARGELVQAIEGIPYYYRQFGYEYALELTGSRNIEKAQLPKLRAGEQEPFRVRDVTQDDVPFLMQVYAASIERHRVACVRTEATWRYELQAHAEDNIYRAAVKIIETAAGEAVGYVVHGPRLFSPRLMVRYFELLPGVSWLAVAPTVLRSVWATAEAYATQQQKELGGLACFFEDEHPLYRMMGDHFTPTEGGYAWYLRVADLPAFLSHIAPVLERRLAQSVAVGFSDELRLNFFVGGVRMQFEAGRIAAVETWSPKHGDFGQRGFGEASFPNLTFLQLLFGYRSLQELRDAFPDCTVASDEVRVLLETLFPKQSSHVWPVA